MATINEDHLKSLAAFDHALSRGPDYAKMAVGGAVVGVIFGFFGGKKSGRSKVGSVAKNAALGAGAGAVAAFGLFEIGKIVSDRSHNVVATAATKGEFAVSFSFPGPGRGARFQPERTAGCAFGRFLWTFPI